MRSLPSVGLELAYFQLLFSAMLQEKAVLRSWQPGNKTQNTAICHFSITASLGSKAASYYYMVSYTRPTVFWYIVARWWNREKIINVERETAVFCCNIVYVEIFHMISLQSTTSYEWLTSYYINVLLGHYLRLFLESKGEMAAVWHCDVRLTDVWINKSRENSYEGLTGLAEWTGMWLKRDD